MVCPSARGGGGGVKRYQSIFPSEARILQMDVVAHQCTTQGNMFCPSTEKTNIGPSVCPPPQKKMEQRGFVHQGKKWVTSRPPPRELTASGPCLSGAARREMKANVSITNSITRPYAGFFAVLGADQCRVGEARKNGVFPCPLIGFVFVLSETVAVLSG